jgi:hypothetical protein
LTGCNEPEVPLLLYVADAPYSAYSNATTLIGYVFPSFNARSQSFQQHRAK